MARLEKDLKGYVKRYGDIALFVLVSALFLLWPEIDLVVSGWFYTPEQGFVYRHNPVIESIYAIFKHMPKVLLPLLFFMWLIALYKGKERGRAKAQTGCSDAGLQAGPSKPWLFLLLALLIGPGILVHLVVKENWDRPRPRQVQEFGGHKDFIPAFIPAAMIKDQPGNNKSFVSGHAAMGFYLMVLGWVFRRRSWFYAGLVVGSVVSLGRIIQGGHFLSDVVLAGFLCYFSYRILAYWMLGHSKIMDTDQPSIEFK